MAHNGAPEVTTAKPLEAPTIRQLRDFWRKVQKTDGCWIWTAHVGKNGYGYKAWGPKGWPRLAHRVSLIIHGIDVPPGMYVDHTCKNTRCVNPDHLRVVTPRISSRENTSNPAAANGRKTHCSKGHPFTPENTALYEHPKVRTRHGRVKPNTTGRKARICLTCFPSYWRWAIVPRDPPPRARHDGGWATRRAKGDSHAE